MFILALQVEASRMIEDAVGSVSGYTGTVDLEDGTESTTSGTNSKMQELEMAAPPEVELHMPPNWTSSWLKVLKKAAQDGFHPKIPALGFGDDTSVNIVQTFVNVLRPCGAVRHGAECFNYYFPQELDDEFLVVWDGRRAGRRISRSMWDGRRTLDDEFFPRASSL